MKDGNLMQKKIATVILAGMTLWSLGVGGTRATDQPAEPDKFFREFVGWSQDKIEAIHSGKAIAKILESQNPDEVFVFGSVYIASTPERYLKFASDLDAHR